MPNHAQDHTTSSGADDVLTQDSEQFMHAKHLALHVIDPDADKSNLDPNDAAFVAKLVKEGHELTGVTSVEGRNKLIKLAHTHVVGGTGTATSSRSGDTGHASFYAASFAAVGQNDQSDYRNYASGSVSTHGQAEMSAGAGEQSVNQAQHSSLDDEQTRLTMSSNLYLAVTLGTPDFLPSPSLRSIGTDLMRKHQARVMGARTNEGRIKEAYNRLEKECRSSVEDAYKSGRL
jgi:hypothetical protein